MKIGFDPSYLWSLHAQPLQWPVALGELVDNALDAGASRVEFNFRANRTIEVIDDGNGCGDIEGMFQFGRHLRQTTTGLGRWGVGLKDAATWLWGELHIRTRHRGIIRYANIDWDKVSRSPDMSFGNPIEKKASMEDPLGTRLVFRNIHKHRKLPPDFKKIKADLSYHFSPALRDGRQILIRTINEAFICLPWLMPQLTDVILSEFDIDGKLVKVEVGIVPAGIENPKSGFSFSHKHRIIFNSGNLGSNGHSTSRICGIVELKDGWTLGKNKTNIVDDEDALGEALWEHCKEIILKAEQQATLVQNDAIQTQVSKALQGILGDNNKLRKEKRDKGNQHGSVIPLHSTKRRKRIKKTQPGERIGQANLFRMEWRDREDGLIGEVDAAGKSCTVFLNSKHTRLEVHRSKENIDALVDHCLWLIAHEIERKQPALPGIFPEEGDMIDKILILLTRQA